MRLLLLVLLAVLPAFGVILFTAEEWRRHEINDAQADGLRLARHASAIHERLVDESHDLLFSLAKLPPALLDEKAGLRQILLAFLREHPSHNNLGVIDPNGKIFLSARPQTDSGDVADRPFFRRAIETRTFAIGDYEVDPVAGKSMVTFAYPILDNAGYVQQVLFTTVDLAWVNELATESLLPAKTQVTVFDDKGTIVAHEPDSRGWIGQSAAQDPAFLAALARKEEGAIEGTSLDNVPRVLAFKPLPGRGGEGNLYVSIGIPAAVATAKADRILTRNLWVLGLAALLTIVVARVGSDLFFLRQVKTLVRTTKRLGAGDLTTRADLPHGAGELDELARCFDDMAATLELRQKEILRDHQALADLEKRFRALIENSSDGIILLTAEAAVSYASPSTTRILGYAVEELIGLNAFDLVHPKDYENTMARFTELVREPGGVTAAQFRVQRKDGSWVWIESTGSNLLAEPSVQAIVSNYRDITKRKQAEEALLKAHEELEIQVQKRTAELVRANEALAAGLAEQEEAQESLRKLSSAVEQTADSVFIVNRDGVIEYVNASFETLTGFSREEALGETRRLVRSGEHDKQFYEHLWEKLLSGEVFRGVFVNRKKDGELYYEESTITPLRNGRGNITHFVAAGRDITQRKRTEEALRRLNERLEKEAERIGNLLHDEAGQFLTAAHIMLAEVARDLPPPQRESLQEVRLHLDQVEKRLRTLSHELRPRILDDLGLVAALEFLAEGVAKRTGIQVNVIASLDEQLPPITEATLYRFAQEALTNASKHARATQATILLEPTAGKIRCSIRDDGDGFDVSAVLDRRGDSNLGLRGIQDRVESLGGMLQVISAPGRGTELLATIPLETDDATPNPLGR
ncbi:MAG TPA: PAS domain S-box protein [Candidatus Methylomirabilis sp.]|nr:PAS domain S-box protein [Candidatus Methylomirabilis sp.]